MMDYIGQIVNGIITLAFVVATWKVKHYLDETEKHNKKLRDELAAERTANIKGTQALLRDRLLQGYHFFKRRGIVTYGEASAYQNMYEAYHSLGKNGVMDGIYEAFRKIPVRPDDEVYPDE